jgi:outer membrane cobalamin receptor
MKILIAIIIIQVGGIRDTIKEYIFPTHEITSTPYLEESYKSKSPMTYITSLQINALNPISFENIFLSLPGLFFLSYGNQGMLSTSLLRSFSSKESYLYIDGFRLNTKRVESFNLSILPLINYERIEILKGGNSAFFGEGPSGGIINFIIPSIDKRFASLKTEFGSFGYNLQEFIFNLSYEYNLLFLFSRTHKDGNDEVNFRGFKLKRENSDFTKKTFLIKHSKENYEQIFLLSENKSGITGPLYNFFFDSAYVSTPNARENDEIILYGIGFNSEKYYFRNQILRDRTYFSNPDFSDTSYYQSLSLRSCGGYKINLWKSKIHMGYEGYREDIKVFKGNTKQNKDTISSFTISTGFEIPEKVEPFLFLSKDILSEEKFFPVKGGLSIYINEISKISFIYSKSLKEPTSFEKIYYEEYPGLIIRGNEDLKPEKSEGYDILFKIFPKNIPLYFSINNFRKNSRDLIEWIHYFKGDTLIHEVKNFSKGYLKGYELETRIGKRNLFLNIFYTYTDAKNLKEKRRIYYIPWNSLRTEIIFDNEKFSSGISYSYNSKRLTDPEIKGDISILNLSFKIKKIYFFDLGFSIYNLLNKNYEFAPGYPIEGRSFKIGIEMKKEETWF